MAVTRSLRRRLLPTMAAAAAVGAGLCNATIQWGETTSSSSDIVLDASVGELVTFVMEPGEKTNIDFFGEPSDHFAVSYRQCSTEDPQPLQLQYSEKLHFNPSLGGCIYAENILAEERGVQGCTFWDLVLGSYESSGIIYEDSEPLNPGRVRLSNEGKNNATVEVAMFSLEEPPPRGLIDQDLWIQDGFTKKENILNTSVNVFFNNDNHYCDVFDCSLTAYLNEKVEDKDGLSLCQVQADGEVIFDGADFDPLVEFTIEIPPNGEYFVTVVMNAEETAKGSGNFTAMQEFGLDQLMVFQTDTSLPDSSGRALAGLSLVTLAWVLLLNTLLSTLGSVGEQHETVVPTLGW